MRSLYVAIIAAVLASSGAASAQTRFSYNGPVVPIPDAVLDGHGGFFAGEPVTAQVDVSGLQSRITKVVFSIDGTVCNTTAHSPTVGIDHGDVQDLKLTLISPDGTQVLVVNRPGDGGYATNLCQVTLDDDAIGPTLKDDTSYTSAPFTGTWKPSNPLSAFIGGSANGTWTLSAQDFSPDVAGNIRAFSITVTAAPDPHAIPTLTEWAMILLAAVLGLFGAGMAVRRRRAVRA